MADFSLQALNDEIENDPDAIGYKVASVWKGDQEIADLINNEAGANPYTVNFNRVDTGLMRAATSFDAYDGLTASETDWYSWLTAGGEIIVEDHLLADLAGIGGTSRWAVGERTEMEPAMAALLQFTGSRAEDLWSEGQNISAGQVGRAANL